MIISPVFVIEGLGYNTDERLADVISQEVTEVEDRGIILAREPLLSDSSLFTTYIPGVASGDFFSGAEVLPKSVFEESLGEADFYETTVGADWESADGVQQAAGVDDS